MEYPKFLALYYYLDSKQYPREATESDKRRIRDQARKYKAYHGSIFRKTGVEGELGPELLHEGNVDELVAKVHAEGHFGYRNTLAKVKLQYTAPKLSSKVKEIVKTCRTCQLRRKKPHARTTFAKPIPVPSGPHDYFDSSFWCNRAIIQNVGIESNRIEKSKNRIEAS
ncbi:hypothetical protein O0I10_012515 [Lichtheimia ornata]|uniref:Integrase zinc-binding domain-containing protein n=1 Tax=Lichtheimia ornata TaxID=688661 RepID=A0AAD7XVQ7_9FUNG|nr:uncharacterized protein O0I10_012515 [Lichtheimia ornata]KAJ8651907.1 hypothetical protein O0I10_012515 [Lichtheimia ornata]